MLRDSIEYRFRRTILRPRFCSRCQEVHDKVLEAPRNPIVSTDEWAATVWAGMLPVHAPRRTGNIGS